jgi:acyl dehydratase
MGLNVDRLGYTYPARGSYEVGREKIRDFAEAIGDDNPAYRDGDRARALGHRDVIAPPTFAAVVTRAIQIEVFADPVLGVDFARLVHGEQRYSYRRPIVAGDRLAASATVENIRSMAGNDILTLRTDITDITDPDGEPVVTGTATLVIRAEEA